MISSPTLDSIYRVPLTYDRMGVGQKMAKSLGLAENISDLAKWKVLMENIDTSTEILRIGMVGKYIGLEDAYYSLNE